VDSLDTLHIAGFDAEVQEAEKWIIDNLHFKIYVRLALFLVLASLLCACESACRCCGCAPCCFSVCVVPQSVLRQ
jgi:hypothetical protein